ncbi:MAG: hypothetical protein NTY77_14340 [Elusimicrobia bacterium]|nr:hypothetical protein [Elusimicrobiota bacterium]
MRHGGFGLAVARAAAALVIGAAGLSGCSPWLSRAETLQLGICGLVASGHGDKETFIRQFGTPTACQALASGQSCAWLSESGAEPAFSDEMRVEFDGAGRFVSGAAQVRRGGRAYKNAEPDEKCKAARTADASGNPPAAGVQVLYDRMRESYAADQEKAAALWSRLSFTGRGQLESYIIATKGQGGTLTWKFHVDGGLPAAEQEFVSWFLQRFTSYQPVKD